MPGFSIINTHLIKPLLFATEKVFEQITAVPNNPSKNLTQEDQPMVETSWQSEEKQASGTSDFSQVKA